MKYLKTIPSSELKSYWVSSYYDVPLDGLCNYDGFLCYYKLEDWEADLLTYEIYLLSFTEEIKWYLKKWLFELLVGSHWSANKTSSYRCSKRNYLKQPWKSLANYYYFLQKTFKL